MPTVVHAPPPPPTFVPPPVPSTVPRPTAPNVVTFVTLVVQAISMWRGQNRDIDQREDWFDWLTSEEDPQRRIYRAKAVRIAEHCCDVVADAGQRQASLAPAAFAGASYPTRDKVKRYRRRANTRTA